MISDYLMYDLKTLQQYFTFFAASLFILVMQSCSVSKQIDKQAHKILLQDSVINTGHIGISIYDPANNTYLYNYNADKYFVPASNVKLFTLYAGMKYLGDSLVGLRYNSGTLQDEDSPSVRRPYLSIEPTGDPTFLHPLFKKHPVYDFLKNFSGSISFSTGVGIRNPYGQGWAKDDYNESYMPPRTAFPIYGNVVRFEVGRNNCNIIPSFLKNTTQVFIETNANENLFQRSEYSNNFLVKYKTLIEYTRSIPIYPDIFFINKLVSDTIKKKVSPGDVTTIGKGQHVIAPFVRWRRKDLVNIIHSQPTDSLLTPMMHNSDNFFAEQTLLMVSNEHLGYMSDEAIIDTLLKTDLKDVPQQPRWVDGSGLSRYNLFTPQSLVYILTKMKNEFGLEKLKTILPTGGEGTLKNYYQTDSGFIYAKTGSLSNQITLSGFLITKKNRLLAFSILANNVMGDGWKVRRAYEQFLKNIRERY
jgi:serine-type D-Ala-D-Ala carboxypeptidase/endopeptidase (penicillin-binding protein 4)